MPINLLTNQTVLILSGKCGEAAEMLSQYAEEEEDAGFKCTKPFSSLIGREGGKQHGRSLVA